MKPSLLKRGNSAKTFKKIIDKAFNILNAQHSLEIKYIENYKLETFYQLNIIENNLLVYPVNFSGMFKGNLELHFNKPLNVKEIRRVDDILNLFIKSPSQYFERTILLNELENYLVNQKKFDKSKVIDFSEYKNSKKNIQVDKENTSFKKLKSHPPIFIEGDNESDKNQLALELHHFLKHKSFVHFNDIESNILSYKDLLELNETTIYINDFNQISTEHKMILLDYFTESNITTHPLIISSSQISYAFLLRDILNRTLLKFLSTYHIRLNKPLSEIKKDGFTTFLDSILKDPKHFFTTH